MKPYLIACDLDGTLLNNDSKLDLKTIDTINELSKLGHKVVIATGRPYRGCIEYHRELNLDTPLISDNGGAIENPVDKGFKKIQLTIPKRIIDKLFTFTKKEIVTAFYSVDNGLYVYKRTDRLSWLYHENEDTFFVEGEFTAPNLPEPSGVMFIVNVAFKNQFETFIKENCENLLSFRDWGSDYKNAIYEVYQKRTSKAEAISLVRQHYQIEEENVIAFGDGLNDIEMIELAATGVAMANAQKELKAVADVVLDETNQQGGVRNYLTQRFLTK
jgi:hypothetical protein